MTIYPSLTISLLSQLTDRELQTNYLNHVDRTAEIAKLLATISDQDLVLRIINLALEVDLNLGSSLASVIAPDLQETIVKQIEQLKICVSLKIKLWRNTRTKAALPYLQDIFIFKYRYHNDRFGIIRTALKAIIEINRGLGVALAIESLFDSRFNDEALEILTELAPSEAINALGSLLESVHSIYYGIRRNAILVLGKIGTEAAIDKIRNSLHTYQSSWSDDHWIQGLGIVGEPAMVQHLIYLIYFADEYTYKSSDDSDYHSEEVSRLCREAIAALARFGGNLAFEVLHQFAYWSILKDYPSPFEGIIEALFRLDCDHTFTALEGAIHSYDPLVRKRAAMAFNVLDAPITERTFSILLNALDEPDTDVQLKIVISIRTNCWKYSQRSNDNQIAIDSELMDRAYAATKPIVVNLLSHPETSIREKAIFELVDNNPDETKLIPPLLGNLSQEKLLYFLNGFYRFSVAINDSHLSVLLKYLDDERLELRAYALANLGSISDDSLLPILVAALKDDELIIRQAAVKGIARFKNVATKPILLELAANSESVTTLIEELWQSDWSKTRSTVLNQWRCDRQFTQQFLEIAETTLIEMVETNHQGIRYLGQIGNSDRAVDAIEKVLRSDNCGYEDEDDGVIALANIGSDKAIKTLLGFLPNKYVLGGWIAIQINNRGKLGIIPQLWLAQKQLYCEGLSDAIDNIQQREGLYNPQFGDRQDYKLFKQFTLYPRLQEVLLEDIDV
jgi:HEAT repeat protein